MLRIPRCSPFSRISRFGWFLFCPVLQVWQTTTHGSSKTTLSQWDATSTAVEMNGAVHARNSNKRKTNKHVLGYHGGGGKTNHTRSGNKQTKKQTKTQRNTRSIRQKHTIYIISLSVRFRLKPDTSNFHEFELHRPSNKGTKLLLKVIKAIIIISLVIRLVVRNPRRKDRSSVIINTPIHHSTPNIQIHPLQNNIHVSKVHCGSAFEPGASGLRYYCTPPVCVPDVLGALAVWRQNIKKNNQSQIRRHVPTRPLQVMSLKYPFLFYYYVPHK